MTHEIQPPYDSRANYNAAHGTNLPEHDDALTSEQAVRINDAYTIKLVFGWHGQSRELQPGENPYEVPEPTSPLELNDKDYEGVQRFVDDMQPGDVLFIEDYGFDEQSPDYSQLHRQGKFEVSRPLLERQRQFAETARRTRLITPWTYARLLAECAGIRVLFADSDAYQAHVQEATGMAPTPARPLVGLERERAARNIVKDQALAELPPEDAPTPDRKPELIVLFGATHRLALERAFREKELQTEAIVLDSVQNDLVRLMFVGLTMAALSSEV